MSERHIARALADVRKRVRRDLCFLSLLPLIALALAYPLFIDHWLHERPGRTRNITAMVVDVVGARGEGRVEVNLAYLDLGREPRSATRIIDAGPGLSPGDRVDFSYVVGEHERPPASSDGDRIVDRLLAGLMALVLLAFAGMTWFSVARYRRRRRLLVHGRREPGHGAEIETMGFAFKGRMHPMWRLLMKRFDADRAAWIECRSEWQAGEPPVLTADTELPPILVDPRDCSRYFLPTGDLAPDRFWAR